MNTMWQRAAATKRGRSAAELGGDLGSYMQGGVMGRRLKCARTMQVSTAGEAASFASTFTTSTSPLGTFAAPPVLRGSPARHQLSPESAAARGWDAQASTKRHPPPPRVATTCTAATRAGKRGRDGMSATPADYGLSAGQWRSTQPCARRVRQRRVEQTCQEPLTLMAQHGPPPPPTYSSLALTPAGSAGCGAQLRQIAPDRHMLAPAIPDGMLTVVKYDPTLAQQQRLAHNLPPLPRAGDDGADDNGGDDGVTVEEIHDDGEVVVLPPTSTVSGTRRSGATSKDARPAPLPVVPDTSVGEEVPEFFRRPGSPLIEVVATTPTSPVWGQADVSNEQAPGRDARPVGALPQQPDASSLSFEAAGAAWFNSQPVHRNTVPLASWDDDDDIDML